MIKNRRSGLGKPIYLRDAVTSFVTSKLNLTSMEAALFSKWKVLFPEEPLCSLQYQKIQKTGNILVLKSDNSACAVNAQYMKGQIIQRIQMGSMTLGYSYEHIADVKIVQKSFRDV